jgi:hypothetical protein
MADGRLMVIFSLGGAMMSSRLRGSAVRCRTGFVPLGGPAEVVLDPFPGDGSRGVVGGGRARLLRGDVEVASRELAVGPGSVPERGGRARARWDDLDVLAFAGTTLWTWVALPLRLDDPNLAVRRHEPTAAEGLTRVAVTVPEGWPASGIEHVVHVDGEGRVRRHEEGRFVHHLSGHCDFGGVVVPTRRRSRAGGDRVAVLWADVVAAALLPDIPSRSLN